MSNSLYMLTVVRNNLKTNMRYNLRTNKGVKRKLSTIYRDQSKIINQHETVMNRIKYRSRRRYPVRSIRLGINKPQWEIYREVSTLITKFDMNKIQKRNTILCTLYSEEDKKEKEKEVDELGETIDETSDEEFDGFIDDGGFDDGGFDDGSFDDELSVDVSVDTELDSESEKDTIFKTFNWNNFNQYQQIPNVKLSQKKLQSKIDSKYWVAATHVKNWIMKDPILDWYNLYYDTLRYNKNPSKHNKKKPTKTKVILGKSDKEEDEAVSILFEKGHLFEAMIVKHINEMFPGEVVNVAETGEDAYDESLAEKTKELMMKGTPIITQAVLHNKKNLTFGVADFLIRSDYINRLTECPSITEAQEGIKAPKLKGKYHYIVVDIKWTTIPLRANGFNILTAGRFPAYKGQLAVYNAALMDIQGMVSQKAFILGKRWKYTSCGESFESDNSFERLGCIDYASVDKDYLEVTYKGICWIRDVKNNGNNWSCLPKPTHYELYPNMSNPYDAPWKKVKAKHASAIKELTQLWYCGPNNRKYAHLNGITKWTDKRCTPEALGICGEVRGPVLAEILEINQPKCKDKIHPEYILDNTGGWQLKHELDFYVDFEAIHHQFYTDEINIFHTNERSGIIFMVGVGYEENGKWKYKDFTMSDYNMDDELGNFKDFVDFLTNKQTAFMKKYNLKRRADATINLFHWGHIEKTQFASLMIRSANANKYVRKFTSFKKNSQWIDFNRIFQREPITIKGAMNFSIKTVGKAMYRHQMIKSIWKKDKDSPQDGLGAMMAAINYYKFKSEWDKMDAKKKKAMKKNMNRQKMLFDKMTYYNEMDCKVLWEIVEYLRNNHIDEDDIDDGDEDYDPSDDKGYTIVKIDTGSDVSDNESEGEYVFSDDD